MVAFHTAETNLRDEVELALIQSITPAHEPGLRFHSVRGDPKAGYYDHDEEDRSPRFFEIGPAYGHEDTYVGAGVIGEKVTHDIVVVYPNGGSEDWRAAAAGDARAIKIYFLKTPTAVSGVQQRRLDPEAEYSIEESDEDETIILTLPLMVHYEYTG